MSKGIYIGIEDKARKVKKAYTGIENKARKIKKGYIGVGGVARPFFSSEPELTYYGRLDDMLETGGYISTALADCALFTPLEPGLEHLFSTIEVINSDLIWQDDILIGGIDEGEGSGTGSAVANVGDYAIFPPNSAGGGPDTDFDDLGNPILVEGGPAGVVNSKFFVSYMPGLTDGVVDFSGASNSKYAVFFGGDWYNGMHNRATAYDENLIRSSFYADEYYAIEAASTTFLDYAVFGGGYSSNMVMCVDTNLLHIYLSPLLEERDMLSAATAGDYLLFAGGIVEDYSEINEEYVYFRTDVIDVYDKSLTKLTPISLLREKDSMGAGSFKNHAIFAGGDIGFELDPEEYVSVKDIELFDINLIRKEAPQLNLEKSNITVQPLGEYLLFAGGCSNTVNPDTGLGEIEALSALEAYTFL